jgi:antitoxin ParD1/3/4
MNVRVPRHFEVWIEEQIASGRFGNTDQVFEEALRLLEQREAKIRDLRVAIQEGLDSGPAEPWEGADAIIRQARENREADRRQELP